MTNNKRLIGIFIFGIITLILSLRFFMQIQQIEVSFIQTIMVALLCFVVFSAMMYTVYKSHSVDMKRVDKLATKYELTMILYDLLKKLAHEEDTHSIYESILLAASKAIPSCEFGSIILSKDDKMVFEASFGFKHDYLQLIEFDVEETALYKNTEGKMDRAIIIPEILSINEEESTKEFVDILKKIGVDKIRSTISAPIFVGDINIGSINLDSTTSNCFDEQDIETLEIFALEVSKFVQLHRVNELNRKMSRYDDLTQIFNRGFCKKEIKQLIEKKTPFKIVSADLNRLKFINDEYGHDIGDQYLLSFVNITKLFIDEQVIFSRYGGDEFMLVFPQTDLLAVKVIMDDITNYLNTHLIEDNDKSITVSFSYGIASFPEDTVTYDDLLKIADARMYEAKSIYKGASINKI